MKTMLPPWPPDEGSMILAAACAQRKLPVVLTSSVRLHSSALISNACVHPTTPAKQHKISSPPISLAAASVADCTAEASVTFTGYVFMVAWGKVVRRWEIVVWAVGWEMEEGRSKRERDVRPWSRRAWAVVRARVPVPPVTGHGWCGVSWCLGLGWS